MRTKFFLLAAFILYFTPFIRAQVDVSEINDLFAQLSTADNQETKLAINQQIITKMTEVLQTNESFDAEKLEIPAITQVFSADKEVKLYTWNVSSEDAGYQFFGFVQRRPKKQKNPVVFQLTDKSDSIPNPKKANLSHNKWFGAQYYDILTHKYGHGKMYTLLGWDGNDLFTNKKIIEILTFSKSGKPKFGASVFQIPTRSYKRIIFEYTQQAQMLLHYDENYKMIVYDHLSPSSPNLKGKYEYYGPDFSQDAFDFQKGKWVYTPNINAQNTEKNKSDHQIRYSYF